MDPNRPINDFRGVPEIFYPPIRQKARRGSPPRAFLNLAFTHILNSIYHNYNKTSLEFN